MSVPVEEPLRRVRMSWEEFLELPDRPRAEFVDGEVVIQVTPNIFRHGSATTQLTVLLQPLFPELYLVPEVFLHLPRRRVRAPDLMLVADVPPDGHVRTSPLLVIEVLSRSTRAEDTIRKSMEYAAGGVGQYWIVDPELRTIDVWRLIDGAWVLDARLDDVEAKAEVELAGVTVPLDLRQILRG